MRVLMVGDIVGRPGRDAVGSVLPELRNTLRIDHVIANGENAARGRGLTERTANELFEAGVDVITSGNHIFDIREFVPLLDRDWPVLRPANYPPEVPGRGVFRHENLTVISLMGRVFMPAPVDDPFRVADELLDEIPPGAVSSSTSTPRPPVRSRRSRGTSMAASRRSSARTRTSPPPMRACCRAAPPPSATSAWSACSTR